MLGQHCCGLHGWLRCLSYAKGDFVTIIHSDMNCSNLLQKNEISFFEKVFCTNLTDQEIISGKSNEKLKEGIKIISNELKPKAVLVLDSCMSLIIGEDTSLALKEISSDINIPIFHEKTSGLRFENPDEIIDNVASFLFDYIYTNNKDKILKKPKSINIFGFEYYGGVEKLSFFIDELAEYGIKVNTIVGPFSDIRLWEESLNAELNICFDKRLYKNVFSRYKEKLGTEVIEAPFPVGFKSTKEFIKLISEKLELDYLAMFKKNKEKLDELEKYILEQKAILKNKKIIYNIASNLDFSTTNSAKGGLLMINLFRELEMDIQIFIQGNPEEHNRIKVEEGLRNLEIFENFMMLGHCGDAYKFFQNETNAIVYGSRLVKEQAEKYNLKFFDYYDFLPGFCKVKKNIEKMVQ